MLIVGSSMKIWKIPIQLLLLPIFLYRRFSSLTHEEKCSCVIVKNEGFLFSFLKTLQSWNPQFLSKLCQGQDITEYLAIDFTMKITEFLRIAWFSQPLLYIFVEQTMSGKFFARFLQWLDLVSQDRVFEWAHKVTNKSDPENNGLWFTHQSYQKIPSWLANEFEKAIVRSYFNRTNLDHTQYHKIQKLRKLKHLQIKETDRSKGKKSEPILTSLMEMKISEASNKKPDDFQSYQKKVQTMEDEYDQEMAQEVGEEQVKKPRKKKNKKKKKNGQKEEKKIEKKVQKKIEKKQLSIEKHLRDIRRTTSEECFNRRKTSISNSRSKEVKQKNSKEKEAKKEKFLTEVKIEDESDHKDHEGEKQEEQSIYSRQSHPQLGTKWPFKEKKRSVSPDSWRKKDMIREDFHEKSSKITNIKSNSQDDSFDEWDPLSFSSSAQEINEHFHCDLKKRKRKQSKAMEDASRRLADGILNKQFVNFTDELSIEANSLYEHKVVCFERIKFFISTMFQTGKAVLFGSNAVGLSLPTSDVDIILFDLPCVSKEEASELLANIAISLDSMGWIVCCFSALSAKVPVVKLEIDPTVPYFQTKQPYSYMNYDVRGYEFLELSPSQKEVSKTIKVDLSINWTGEYNIGNQATKLMKNWMSEYPIMHNAMMAFKYILAQRNFNENFKGGLGSYCLFVMVAAFIKQKPQLANTDEAEFFLNILKFYGVEFENQTKSIILKDKGSSFISLQETLELINDQNQNSGHEILNNLLRIFDPVNNRMMSGSCLLYNEIKAEFRRIYKELTQARDLFIKQFSLAESEAQARKILENEKVLDKEMYLYQLKSGFCIKSVFDGA